MSSRFAYYITGDNGDSDVYTGQWRAQTFTPATTHTVTSVKLKLSKTGSPGTITIRILATTGGVDGVPTGGALCSGTTNGNTLPDTPTTEWREISFGAGTPLTAGVTYAITASCTTSYPANYFLWRTETPAGSYASGKDFYSLNAGVLWNATGRDDMFEEWGYGETGAPSVTTQPTSAVATTSATGNGTVTGLGIPAATQYGHVWAIGINPTVALTTKTSLGVPAATGAFTSNLVGLKGNTLYYTRAYIESELGASYGVNDAFLTDPVVPEVTTLPCTAVHSTTFLGHGTVVNIGGSNITAYGVCYVAGTATPTTGDSVTDEGALTVPFTYSSQVTGLNVNTLYTVRAYATNATGTGYGANVTVTTNAVGVPVVTTDAMTGVQETTATGNGTIINIGAASISQHGHCWDTSLDASTALATKTTNGSAIAGAFTSAITGLLEGTTYYTRAYATNLFGTSYGDNVEFHTTGAGTTGVGFLSKGNILVKQKSDKSSSYLIYVGYDNKQYGLQGTELV